MINKSTILRAFFVLTIASVCLFISCKKDKLKVTQDKEFLEVNFKFDPSFPFNSGWQLALKPNGVADIIPGGDIIWRGRYKINGSLLTVKADNETYKFDIINQNEIKEKSSGTILRTK